MKTLRTLALAAGAALAAAPQARGQAGLLVPTSTGRPDAEVLSLREMAVDVGIARGYARVNVRQVYENHTSAVQEGTYRFALPPSGAVGDFAVWDGLVRIPGVILEKQRARAIYRELTTQRIDPGLLQQGEEEGEEAGEAAPSGRPSGGALFSVHVAPIPPYATKRLELQFQQEVPVIGRQGEFRLALRPPEGEPPVAGALTVRVRLEDGEAVPDAGALLLVREGRDLVFRGGAARLERDLVVRFEVPPDVPALQLAAFRNPGGTLPDGIALAPWERPSEVPPERDGFFLLEAMPGESAPARQVASTAGGAEAEARPAIAMAVLFDTSLSHRWSGLETAYAHLVRVLGGLRADDRFALVPFDRRPDGAAALRAATPEAVEEALTALRARPLGPGTDVVAAVAAGRRLAGEGGRIVLLTEGQGNVASKMLQEARGGLPLFTILTGGEMPEAYRAASAQVLASTSTEIESRLFFERLLAEAPVATAPPKKAGAAPVPFRVSGGEPQIRDVYPVMVQPPEPGSLSGWIGRYGAPVPQARFEMDSPLFAGGGASLDTALPETALEARDLPRRWARARVDHLLMLIEAEGEKREWVEEVIALSKRYKFVTPYTAFLAAPRSLLRPRRIQPGDPVLRVECDPAIRSVVALFPFGLRLPLVKRPGSRLWEGRFLVPESVADGRYAVRIVLRDGSGARITEMKHLVLDGTAPRIVPDVPAPARPGERVRIAVRADEDVVVLSARLGDGAPVPLRWDAASRRSVGELRVPPSALGPQEVVFEAMDGAKNVGFARTRLEVKP
jgi:Ca-activated chloride channel family protein